MSVPISPPISNIVQQTYDNFKISSINIVLGTSATFSIVLFNGDKVLNAKMLTMSGPDYANWGSQDDYATNWILTQLRQ